MLKRIVSLLLCLSLVFFLAVPAMAAKNKNKNKDKEETPPEAPVGSTLYIATAERLLDFAELCRLDTYSQNLTVELKADLDLTGIEFPGIPIFCGVFRGNGHTISGLTITHEGSNQGLFRYLTASGQILDLKVKGTVSPGGTQEVIGGIVGNNAGQITGCSFEGAVSGGSKVGGIAGSNALTGVIRDCQVLGTVNGSHFTGGITGWNRGIVQNCVNYAKINTTPQENTVSLTDVTLDSMRNSESAATVTDIGGIAGNSAGIIQDCHNHSDVGYQHMGYNVGGIAGTQSGTIQNCENWGHIRGRKEVGGIVGQMEPAARIEFDEDTLQILQKQLDAMSGTVNGTAANVQSAGQAISGQVWSLQEDVIAAGDALELLLPEDMENPQPPSEQNIQLARNALSDTMASMMGKMGRIGNTTMSAMGVLSNNLKSIQNQIREMGQTLGNAPETLGGTVKDVSDEDTEEDLTGKVLDCFNYGSVLGDLNAGGIVGAMAPENDLDIQDDLIQEGTSSLNFESQLRAVVLRCGNRGTVTAGKQAAGGIAGWQALGLVKDCQNTGILDCPGAAHIGGISGQSTGFIRSCYANCILRGNMQVGGIAGTAAVTTNCRSLVRLDGITEQGGAILGGTEENINEVEIPIAGNLYLVTHSDPGGIDGISYDGQAQPLKKEVFFQLEGLPEIFRRALVTFVFEDGTSKVFEIPTGGRLSPEKIPELPEKEHLQPRWEGLAEADLDHIYFDLTFRAQYTGLSTVLATEAPLGQRPQMLLLGEFPEGTALTLTELGTIPPLAPEETLLGSWGIQLAGEGTVTAGRLLLPETQESGEVRVYVLRKGTWVAAETETDGSYAVFSLQEEDEAVALTAVPQENWLLPAAAAGGILLAVVILLVLLKKRRKA